MKVRTFSILILALVGTGFSTLGVAQMKQGNMQGSGMAAGNMQNGNVQSSSTALTTQHSADSAMVEGMVKKVDKSKGTVTLAHGSINGMPPMTMTYKVKDPAWFDNLQVGQKIRFATDPADGGMTVTRFETVK